MVYLSTIKRKTKGPAQRYMIIMDGKGKIRRCWGGYSPKLFDAHFIKAMNSYLEEELEGAKIVGDNHFEKCNEYMNNAKFYCNVANVGNKRNRDGERLSKLTKHQEKCNEQIKNARAHVEFPIGDLKKRFKALENFAEDEKQQDYLTTFTLAIYNEIKY
jgi:hypothetical protein